MQGSINDICVMKSHLWYITFHSTLKIRPDSKNQMGSQSGDCRWPLKLVLQGIMRAHMAKLYIYHPQEWRYTTQPNASSWWRGGDSDIYFPPHMTALASDGLHSKAPFYMKNVFAQIQDQLTASISPSLNLCCKACSMSFSFRTMSSEVGI